jgi:hypothetical protein
MEPWKEVVDRKKNKAGLSEVVVKHNQPYQERGEP